MKLFPPVLALLTGLSALATVLRISDGIVERPSIFDTISLSSNNYDGITNKNHSTSSHTRKSLHQISTAWFTVLSGTSIRGGRSII